jgi:hypothetical protein
VEFLLDKVAKRKVLSEYLGLFCQFSIPPPASLPLIILLSIIHSLDTEIVVK